ncbi:ABC transporter ATP-binding protein [Paracoccus alkanivorans]|uniref:ATP-binding cassette domain-containing protein n=1 Tax=Paracoccus alkanivorans TaxID=2116655 RepID=A0A3M0MJ39_9RHOB|nr:oligopeptide/dipeptide ABC transporter ATP-binding protein [Paracoccus alkanivorans]RMC37588.1 ATP-binding cassette domain-containing protein [Paracoccus alkanivorans]
MSDPVIEVRDLKLRFPSLDGTEVVHAVDGVSFRIEAGETFGIIGESGSGKSTIGRVLVGLLNPSDGDIVFAGRSRSSISGREWRKARRGFQMIFQDSNAALNPRMTILDSLIEPMRIAGGRSREEMRETALAALVRVGLRPDMAQRYPHELSGGQKQRVNIARILPLEPRLVVCDEVVAALDVSIRGEILNLFRDLQRDLGLAYAFIAHDISVVAQISDRVAVTYLGRFVELGATGDVIERALHPYTVALLSAEPQPLPRALRDDRRLVLQGDIPSPVNPPSGCRFHTRCPWATEICGRVDPEWRELRSGHRVACHHATPEGLPSPGRAGTREMTATWEETS